MNRTSYYQHDNMLEFMERHGDLLIPSDTPAGRLERLRQWQQLVHALNQDATGAKKTEARWKKVWSDWKGNTKKKAAKIHLGTTGTGGGPALKLALTDLEQRVLALMGPEAATGLDTVNEVGVQHNVMDPQQQSQTQEDEQHIVVIETIEGPVPAGSSHSTPFPTEMVEASGASPFREQGASVTSPVRQDTPRRPTIRRRRSTPRRISGRQPAPPRQHVPAVSEMFLRSDDHGRQLFQVIATEHLRQRDLELQQQVQWQVLFEKMIQVLDKFNQ